MGVVLGGPVHDANFTEVNVGESIVADIGNFLELITMQDRNIGSMGGVGDGECERVGGRGEPGVNRWRRDGAVWPAVGGGKLAIAIGIDFFADAFMHFDPHGSLGIIGDVHDGTLELGRLIDRSAAD